MAYGGFASLDVGCSFCDQACQRTVVPATKRRAEVPDFLRLTNNLGESYAPISDQFRAPTDKGSYPRYGSVGFSSVADGSIAGAGDDCHLLAGDAP
jgi:hypothetical protein